MTPSVNPLRRRACNLGSKSHSRVMHRPIQNSIHGFVFYKPSLSFETQTCILFCVKQRLFALVAMQWYTSHLPKILTVAFRTRWKIVYP